MVVPTPLHQPLNRLTTNLRFDNDMYAHLNNTVYAMYFDSIVNTYLINHCGMDPFSVNNKDQSSSQSTAEQVGIIVSSYCDYFSSVSFPDVLDLCLRVAKLGSSSVTYEIGVFKQGEDDVKVVGGYTHVFCARETMRPTKEGMEAGVRRGLERLIVKDKERESKL